MNSIRTSIEQSYPNEDSHVKDMAEQMIVNMMNHMRVKLLTIPYLTDEEFTFLAKLNIETITDDERDEVDGIAVKYSDQIGKMIEDEWIEEYGMTFGEWAEKKWKQIKEAQNETT